MCHTPVTQQATYFPNYVNAKKHVLPESRNYRKQTVSNRSFTENPPLSYNIYLIFEFFYGQRQYFRD